jgi:hypothetical protein
MLQIYKVWDAGLKQGKWLVVLLVSFLLMCYLLFWSWQRTKEAEKRYHQAIVIQQDQMKRSEDLSKALHISEMNGKELKAAYEALNHSTITTSFTVQAASIEGATKQVAERINKGDSLLPSAALERSDRTAVVPDEREYKVDVLKVNLDKSWEISVGVGSHRGDVYIPVGIQRNYAPHKAVAAEVHFVPDEMTKGKIKTSGWEVKHVWRY